MMITEQDLSLPRTLYSLSVSLQSISQSYLLTITKFLHLLGIYPEYSRRTNELSPLKLSAFAYFKALIKYIKQDDVYLNLHITFVLTKPNIKEYYRNIQLLKSFYAYSAGDNLLFESYYDKFGSNQTILALKNCVNTQINKEKISEEISFIFRSDDNNASITFDMILNELKQMDLFFKHFYKYYQKYAKNKVMSGLSAITFLLYPSTYTNKLGQYKNDLKTSCFSVLYSINSYLPFDMLSQVHQRSMSKIYSSVYQPYENVSVYIKHKSITIYTNLSQYSSAIKKAVIDYIAEEVHKIRNYYGNFTVTVKRNSSNIYLTVKSQVININKSWLSSFVNHIYNNIVYVKAKETIDNIYIKWLRSPTSDNSNAVIYLSMIEDKEKKGVDWNIQRDSFTILSISIKESGNLSSKSLIFEKKVEDEFELGSIAQSKPVMISNYKEETTNETDEGIGFNLSKELFIKHNKGNTDYHIDDNLSTIALNQSMKYNDSCIDNETESLLLSNINHSILSENNYQRNNPFSKKKKKKVKRKKNLRVCLNEIH